MPAKTTQNAMLYRGLRFKQFLIKAAYDLTPPLIWRSLFKLRRAEHSDKVQNITAYSNRLSLKTKHPAEVCFHLGSPVLDILVEKIRYANGISYQHPEHQMKRFYAEGQSGLANYYSKHHPTNIFEKVFLPAPERDNVPGYGLPWCEPPMPQGEKGLSADHGVQHYGPASGHKITVEAERLTRVYHSLQHNGFLPEHGFPSGYFLCNNNDDWVFVTMSGQHRTAAMVALEFKTIPAQMLSTMPRIIYERDLNHWPMVANGMLSPKEALQIFHAFFPAERKLIFKK